jgi:hypothetical protein
VWHLARDDWPFTKLCGRTQRTGRFLQEGPAWQLAIFVHCPS